MLEAARKAPQENSALIEGGLERLYLLKPHETMGAFGLTVDPKMTVVPARILPPPSITYANGQFLSAKDGAWNILASKFQRGAHIAHWAVMVVKDPSRFPPWKTDSDPNLTNFLQRLKQKCISTGMSIADGVPTVVETPVLQKFDKKKDSSRTVALDEIINVMEKLVGANPRPFFILVLLSHQDHFIYPGIKRIGDVELGIHTVYPNPKREDQYFSNVALKLNTKLGGINHKPDLDSMRWLVEKRTMVVGADVTHPSPPSIDGTPSLAAVVASFDSNSAQFWVSMRLQDTKEEMIADFKDMMVERLSVYGQKKEGVLPERVLLLRDGVSEGQFDLVISKEFPLIQAAFDELYVGDSIRPKLLICICGKRHHARFYPTNANKTPNGNTKPGTVTDKGVGDIYRFDFFLQAHFGIEGTVKATHYTVVYDEIGLDADVLQQGTHTASYSYVRATRDTSLCPAAYYSDLACERGRLYFNEFYNPGVERVGGAIGSKETEMS
ncbi:Protein argonaute 2 Short=OsAGO2 [Serendipita indica DSM 11827]|nr:Protein argonaute 2 Short=OsAGO2 [Serendipita indica DSM 11827]